MTCVYFPCRRDSVSGGEYGATVLRGEYANVFCVAVPTRLTREGVTLGPKVQKVSTAFHHDVSLSMMFVVDKATARHDALPTDYDLPGGRSPWTWLTLTANQAQTMSWLEILDDPDVCHSNGDDSCKQPPEYNGI